jgi:hypothetical protein
MGIFTRLCDSKLAIHCLACDNREFSKDFAVPKQGMLFSTWLRIHIQAKHVLGGRVLFHPICLGIHLRLMPDRAVQSD